MAQLKLLWQNVAKLVGTMGKIALFQLFCGHFMIFDYNGEIGKEYCSDSKPISACSLEDSDFVARQNRDMSFAKLNLAKTGLQGCLE
jgi:hypothetical protein